MLNSGLHYKETDHFEILFFFLGGVAGFIFIAFVVCVTFSQAKLALVVTLKVLRYFRLELICNLCEFSHVPSLA